MITDLTGLAQLLQSARKPEEVFSRSKGSGVKAAETERHRLLKIAHPDLHTEDGQEKLAQQIFKDLETMWARAEKRFEHGIYGTDAPDPATWGVSHRNTAYQIGPLVGEADLADLFQCTYEADGEKRWGIFKVSLNPTDSDLIENEAQILRGLAVDAEHAKLVPFVPHLVDSFSFLDQHGRDHRANVLSFPKEVGSFSEFYTLEEVRQAYPTGIDPKDAAWIYRRLLMALSLAHLNKIVHSSVLPQHVLVHPARHGLILYEWAYAVTDPEGTGDWVKALSAAYRLWYPKEVMDKKPPPFGLDLTLAARTMILLLGGDPQSGITPPSVPRPMASFFRGCILASPPNAGELFKEFDELLLSLYGPHKFHPFTMPANR